MLCESGWDVGEVGRDGCSIFEFGRVVKVSSRVHIGCCSFILARNLGRVSMGGWTCCQLPTEQSKMKSLGWFSRVLCHRLRMH